MNRSKKPLKKVSRAVAIIADGEDESWYIETLKKHYKNEVLNRSKLCPELPQHKKIDELFKLSKEKIDKEFDNVILIIDLDTPLKERRDGNDKEFEDFKKWHKRYEETQNGKSQKYKWLEKVLLIINNPCLEYWHLMHYEYTTKFYSSYNNLVQDLKKFLPDYKKSKDYYLNPPDIYQRLGGDAKLREARQNAAKLGKFDIDNCMCSGITEMDEILDYFDKQ